MLLQHLLPFCLAGLATAAATDDGSSNLLSACNKADIALVQFNSQSQSGLCKSWMNSQKQSSAIQGMTPDELTAACNCISHASQEMKLALQLPVVRVAKTSAKPTPKPVVKTTPKTTPKSTAAVIKTTPKVSIKTSSSISSKKPSSTTPNKAITSSAKKSSSSSSSVSSSSVRYCGLYPCSKLTLKPWSSSKASAKSTPSASSSSTRPCIGAACSKLTAKTSSKTGTSAKSSTQSSSSKSKSSAASSKSGSSVSSSVSTSRSGTKVSSSTSASRSGTKVSSSSKSGTKLSSSVTGTVGKGISSRKSSSTTLKAKPTSGSGDDPGSDSGGDDSGSGSSDNGGSGASETTQAGDGDAPMTSDEPAATTSASDDGSATSDDGSSPTTAPTDDGSLPKSTTILPASTLTSTKPRSATLVKSSTTSRSISTKTAKSDASVPVVTKPSSSAAVSTTRATSTAETKSIPKPSPICTSPLSSNATFQLYIYGTNSAIDGTPMQGLLNGATAVGFSVGYAALNFTLDCTTGYVYWGSNSVLSGNRQAFSVKSQSVVVAPLGDSNNSPLSCSIDGNFALNCQYTSSRSPDAFQGWALSTGDARYLAMSQSNATGITLKAVPLTSNSAIKYPTHSTNQKLLTNGEFAASSAAPWGKFTQGRSADMGLTTPAVNATQSCYAFAGMLSITPNNNFVNGYAWGGISQPGVTLYMGEQLFLGYDIFLNYPTGLPSGVRCDVQVKGTEHDTLSYVRYDSSSPSFVSFNTTTTASYNGTGSFSITAYCQGQPGGPWPSLNLGFNNVRLLAAYDPTDAGAALTCGFKGARDTIQSATLQPYCSSLLSYSTPTTTLTTIISTTTTSTLTVDYGKRKRGIVTAAPAALMQSVRPRQLDVPANVSTTASSVLGGGEPPNALATFASQDVTDACSVEAMPVTTTVIKTSSTTTTVTAYATQTKAPTLFILSNTASTRLYVSRDSSGAVLFVTDVNAAYVFYLDGAGILRGWTDPSFTLVDHYEPNSGTADNRIYIEAPSSASYPLTCYYKGPNAGDYYGTCQSSGPPNGNPVVYGFGWCPNTNALYMIPNSSNVRCSGGYAFAGFFLVAAPVAPVAPSCTNGKLENTDFTKGLDKWDSGVQSGTVTLKGEAAQLYCNAKVNGPYDRSVLTQTISTCPGTKYTTSWRYKIDTVNPNNDTFIYLYTGDSVKSENIIMTSDTTVFPTNPCRSIYTDASDNRYDLRCNVDYMGGDFSITRKDSLKSCIDACGTFSQCDAIVFNGGTCYMKNQVNPPSGPGLDGTSTTASYYSALKLKDGQGIDTGNSAPTWVTKTATFTANDKTTLIGIEAVCGNYGEFSVEVDDITAYAAA